MTPVRNTEQETISMYGPYYNCRVNFTINSFQSNWLNIFEIGDGSRGDRHPALYLNPNNGVQGYSYGRGGQKNLWIELDTPYVVEMSQKNVNGDVKFSFIFNEIERMWYENVQINQLGLKDSVKVFFSNNHNDAADVTIHSFFLEAWSD